MSSTSPNSTYLLGQFIPVAYIELGVLVGALSIVFLIYVFREGIANLLNGILHRSDPQKWDNNKF